MNTCGIGCGRRSKSNGIFVKYLILLQGINQSPESLFNTLDIQLFIHNNSLLSDVISYLFFKAQACSETEVVVDDDNFVFSS